MTRVVIVGLIALVAAGAAAFTIATKFPVGAELRVEALSYNADADALTFRFRWTWRDQGEWHTKREQGDATASRTRTWDSVWTAPLLVIEQEGGGGLVVHVIGWKEP